MPIHVFWDDESCSILRIVLADFWTREDLYEAHRTMVTLCQESLQRVDVLMDLRGMNYRPPHNDEVSRRIADLLMQPTNIGLMIYIVNDFTFELFRSFLKRYIPGINLGFVESLQEAREFIAQAREGAQTQAFFPHNRQLN